MLGARVLPSKSIFNVQIQNATPVHCKLYVFSILYILFMFIEKLKRYIIWNGESSNIQSNPSIRPRETGGHAAINYLLHSVANSQSQQSSHASRLEGQNTFCLTRVSQRPAPSVCFRSTPNASPPSRSSRTRASGRGSQEPHALAAGLGRRCPCRSPAIDWNCGDVASWQPTPNRRTLILRLAARQWTPPL